MALLLRWAACLLFFAAVAPGEVTICDVSHYGAKADGTSDSTHAIQQALDECAGTKPFPKIVLVPAGAESYHAGSLRLRSHQRLIVEPGAVLQGLTDASRYPLGQPFPSFCGTDSGTKPDCRGSCALPFLGAEGISDVEISGGGTVDGAETLFFRNLRDKKGFFRRKKKKCRRIGVC